MLRPKVIVLDSDGILTSGGQALPGAHELLNRLIESGLPHYVLTNCPFLEVQWRLDKYRKLDLPVDANRLYGAAHPLPKALEALHKRSGRLWAIGVEDPAPWLAQRGWTIDLECPASDLDGVLLLDDDWTWEGKRVATLAKLFQERPDLPLIVPNPDLLFPDRPGELMLTSGAWVRLLQEICSANGVELSPICLGKPHPPAFEMVQDAIDRERPGTHRSEVLMVGDSPATDILGANRFGWSSALVETGNLHFGEGREGCQPQHRFADLHALMRELHL